VPTLAGKQLPVVRSLIFWQDAEHQWVVCCQHSQ